MSRVLAVLLFVCLWSDALALTPPPKEEPAKDELRNGEFQVDRAGHVYWIDSYGYVRRDGGNTGWKPQESFRIDDVGHVIYMDSYGRMKKDGYSYSGTSDHGASGSAPDGTLYWINSWSSELYREEHRLGYKASWQSAIRVDGAGNILYVNADTHTLWRNGQDTGVHFLGLNFQVNDAGDVYYYTWLNPSTSQIWKFDPDSGQRTFVDQAHNPPFLKLDRAGKPWYVGTYGRMMRDRVHMYGMTHFGDYGLDAAGNVYTRHDDFVMKNGRSTGYKAEGHFAVTPGGDVFAVTDTTWGRIEKNGMTLGFTVR
jgi:hypothetical protein